MLLAEHVHQLHSGLLVVVEHDAHCGSDVALFHLRAQLVACFVRVTVSDQRSQQSVLGGEVAYDGRQRHVGFGCNTPHRDGVEVLRGDDLTSRLEDMSLGVAQFRHGYTVSVWSWSGLYMHLTWIQCIRSIWI